MIRCLQCQEPFDLESFSHRCPTCGGLFGFPDGLRFPPGDLDQGLPGIWPYKDSFSLPEQAPIISLGEGNTSLIEVEILGQRVWLKMESQNPTGSFKDRGAAVLVSWLMAAGVKDAVEDSSGNAGAAFAAYASRAGIRGRVFIPSYASGPKRAQIESYGLEVISVPGPRSEAARAVLDQVSQGAVYASHAYLPQGTAGMATIAYELVDQLGKGPGTILMPVGHGSLLLGLSLGFQALLASGEIERLPGLVGIQAQVCDPLYQAFWADNPTPSPAPSGMTLAEGVAIADPYHGEEVLRAVRDSKGSFVHVSEEQIQQGQEALGQMGIYVEMTSGLIWSALDQLRGQLEEPVVCIITGHGLKND